MYFKDLWWSFLLIAICSYFIGNLNFAILISQSKKKDIRDCGSGNPGTLNMSRQFGLKFGVLTLFLDILKGAVPTFIALKVYGGAVFGDSTLKVGEMAQYLAGFFAVLGHICPVVYKFKGGKGIATTIGVFLVGEPIVTVIFALLAIGYILITEIGSVGSFIATAPSAVAAGIRLYNDGFAHEPNFEYGMAFFIVADLMVFGIILMTWIAHRQNIKRLMAGEEHFTDWMRMIHDAKAKRKSKDKAKEKKHKKNNNSEKTENEETGDNMSELENIKIIEIKNDKITAKISTRGAELISVVAGGKERVWQGNEKSWKGHQPVLFPMCGSLRGKKYTYNGAEYNVRAHGFARNSDFKVVEHGDDKAVLLLTENAETLKAYPFKFEFYVIYELINDSVKTTFKIKNTDTCEMFTSCGSHESFNLGGEIGEGQQIVFEKDEKFLSNVVDFDTATIYHDYDDFGSGKTLELTRDKFDHDTIVFVKINSRRVKLVENGKVLADFSFDAPNLLMWTSPVYDKFVCIEPWFNYPDYIDASGDIKEKEGLIWLKAGEEFTSVHTVKYL